MKGLVKAIDNNTSILISSNERLGLYALKFIADLGLTHKVKNIILIDVEQQVEEYFKVLLPKEILSINPPNQTLLSLINNFPTLGIGVSVTSNEFAIFKESENKSVLFIENLGIFREGLIKYYKNIQFIESKFSNYIQNSIKAEITPATRFIQLIDSKFVNRTKEIKGITDFLVQEKYRGLKLLGLPGIGKRSILKELKSNGVLNTNCFEFYFQDEVDSLEDILSSLFTKLGLRCAFLETNLNDLRNSDTKKYLKEFFIAFDKLIEANIIFYNVHIICNSQTNKLLNSNIYNFLQLLISRSTYNGNKVIFTSDINFRLDTDTELKLTDESLGILKSEFIKELMSNEFINQGYPEFAKEIVVKDDIILHDSVNGHPQISKLFVKVAEAYGIDNLLNDKKLKKHFTEKHKVDYLLSKIEISDDEISILEILSLFIDYIEYDFIVDFANYSLKQIDGLINKFLLEVVVLEDGKLKYYVPSLIKDVIKSKISNENLREIHNKIGDYYWAISENLERKSSDIIEGYRKAFYHYTESPNFEKINFLTLRFRPKIIQKAYLLFEKKYFIGSWNLFNEIYKSGNLDRGSDLAKYIEAEIILDKKEENTLLKITKAIEDNSEDVNLKIVYAKYLQSKKDYPKAIEVCEDLIKDNYPTNNNKLNILYPNILLQAKLIDDAVLKLRRLISFLENRIEQKPYFKYTLVISYSFLVEAEFKRLENIDSIVKNCLRNIEQIGISNQRIYTIIEDETEETEKILRIFEEAKNLDINIFEYYIRYLARKNRIENIKSFKELAKEELRIDNIKVEEHKIELWKEKSNRSDNLYYYVMNKMSKTPTIEFKDVISIENYIKEKLNAISTLVDYCDKAASQKINLERNLRLIHIQLLVFKETLINLKKITFICNNEDEKSRFLEQNLGTIVYVEGETDELYLKKALKILDKNHLNISIKWIGNLDSRGNVNFSGDTALNQTFNYYISNPHALSSNKNIILLYDSDTNKPPQDFMNLFVRKMAKNELNTIFKIGVENLLTFQSDFDISSFYSTIRKIDDYGGESIVKKLDKMKLCNWVCNEASIPIQKMIFKNFISVINTIEDVLNQNN